MASWIEIDRVRKDPDTFRPLAARLLADPNFERTDFADGFLENISNWKGAELSTRQGEVLLDLRDKSVKLFKIREFNVSTLIAKCYCARLELGREEDTERLEKLWESGRTYIRGWELGWFKRICKQLGFMEEYM